MAQNVSQRLAEWLPRMGDVGTHPNLTVMSKFNSKLSLAQVAGLQMRDSSGQPAAPGLASGSEVSGRRRAEWVVPVWWPGPRRRWRGPGPRGGVMGRLPRRVPSRPAEAAAPRNLTSGIRSGEPRSLAPCALPSRWLLEPFTP